MSIADATKPIPVASDRIDIWPVDLRHPDADPSADAMLLSDAERTRASRFRFARDRDAYVVGRAALRRILARYCGGAPAALALAEGAYGKPELANGETGIAFNSAHSAGLYLCAVSGAATVGIDVEGLREIEDPVGLARSYFSRAEIASLAAVPPAERSHAFLDGWTRKEAYLKALGTGLATGLDSFGVSLAPGETPRLLFSDVDPAHVDDWSVHALRGFPGYAGAVIASGPHHTLRRMRLP